MRNTIIYLLGHYGVGKLTVARAICTRTGARLFDNHLANNIVFSLIRADGRTPLPDAVWDHIWNIRAEAVAAIRDLAPPGASFVLTNALHEGDDMDRAAYDQIASLAATRNATFIPVILTCTEEENMRRIGAPDREERLKTTDTGHALHVRRSRDILTVDHPNRFDLDNTDLPPGEAADIITEHAERLG